MGYTTATNRNLVLNAIPLRFDQRSLLSIGELPFDGWKALNKLRHEVRGSHVVKRSGNVIETVAVSKDGENLGKVRSRPAGTVFRMISSLLFDWLIQHFANLRKTAIRKRKTLELISQKEEDNLLKGLWPGSPDWLGLKVTYKLECRVEYPQGKPEVLLAIDVKARPIINLSVKELLENRIQVEGLYVQRRIEGEDSRLLNSKRLVGRVARVSDGTLILEDHDSDWSTISASDAYLEPRIEVLAKILSILRKDRDSPDILQDLKIIASAVTEGRERLRRIKTLAGYFKKQTISLCPALPAKFEDLLTINQISFHEVMLKPALIFESGGRRTHKWNQGGLDKFGPIDQFQFTPKILNIAVICQARCQGDVETFVQQFFDGIRGTSLGGDIGFLRRFCLEKPSTKMFQARSSSPKDYKKAAIEAMEHITDQGKKWSLVLVQIEEGMEELNGDDNPYLSTKAFFLSKGIAIQSFKLKTARQWEGQRAYSLNNMGLACYAKLGGNPWLLPIDQKVAHELVIGLGSFSEKSSRFGAAERHVGITTVFSGDGQYLLQGRTPSVPFEEYREALISTLRRTIEEVRKDFAWSNNDPVRLVFHVFKLVKDSEVDAVQTLMRELNLPHAEYAFLHIGKGHPFQVFDELESGVPAGKGKCKGQLAPPRGLVLKLSGKDALICLKGAKELKQSLDGHPSPIFIHLHRKSTFHDLTYLSRQIFAFSCHSWRSFQPASLPITIGYSKLVARNMKMLEGVTGWSSDAIIGQIGRTRWFL